jgi:YidC/Oxa1 family membrane protein insertase
MEFGTWFGWICKLLLPTLNWIYALIPNYGIAIIILTVLVRIVFWPVTHKSTQDMKKMAAIQPLVAQLREKYKDKPQKLNQETMALYREHKVNPMSGCLPMLIQIPVFIALFTVLRSAVELRFAPFLWIRDLSEPEGLFHGARLFQLLPLVDSLNILPLLMTATTIWQQKLTPAAGDPQQQKMMMLMPVFMLFLFYNMAAALVLYWTTSQVLSIAQILLQRRVSRPKAPSAAGP